jgi:homoserine dehydrogenase
LNGTSNFIVSQMEEYGTPYAKAVKEAQRRGYAELDPTLDVDGTDAAQKLAILAHLAFGVRIRWSQIPRVGIDKLHPADLRYARELGYRIKLLAVANLAEEGLELHVSPSLVRIGRPLAEVREAYNAISVVGDAVGKLFYHGLGAGQMPTASAVVADMIDTAVGRTSITFKTLELWSNRESPVTMRDFSKLQSRYYMRFTVEDRPGVLAQITGVLGQHNISIASVIQHEHDPEGDADTVPLVIMTHSAAEGDAASATKEIDRLPCVHGRSVRMRVLDD